MGIDAIELVSKNPRCHFDGNTVKQRGAWYCLGNEFSYIKTWQLFPLSKTPAKSCAPLNINLDGQMAVCEQ